MYSLLSKSIAASTHGVVSLRVQWKYFSWCWQCLEGWCICRGLATRELCAEVDGGKRDEELRVGHQLCKGPTGALWLLLLLQRRLLPRAFCF